VYSDFGGWRIDIGGSLLCHDYKRARGSTNDFNGRNIMLRSLFLKTRDTSFISETIIDDIHL
jgi:hypothetical protein